MLSKLSTLLSHQTLSLSLSFSSEIDSPSIFHAYSLWTSRGFFVESAWNFLMEPIRDIACLWASTILSFESPFMLPHCSRKRDVCEDPLSFEGNFGFPKIETGSNLSFWDVTQTRLDLSKGTYSLALVAKKKRKKEIKYTYILH